MDIHSLLRNGFWKGIGLALGLGAGGALLAVTVTGLNTFSSGEVISSSAINTNFNTLKTAIESVREVPVGTIVAWHKSFAGTPAIPAGWVECNGQTIADTESPYNGQAVPNLNAQFHGGTTRGAFLRGWNTSGILENDAFQTHTHSVSNGTGIPQSISPSGGAAFNAGIVYGHVTITVDAPDTGRTANETRPVNMSVVWIMRVK